MYMNKCACVCVCISISYFIFYIFLHDMIQNNNTIINLHSLFFCTTQIYQSEHKSIAHLQLQIVWIYLHLPLHTFMASYLWYNRKLYSLYHL